MTEPVSRRPPSPNGKKRATCALCSSDLPVRQLVSAGALRPSLNEHVAARHADVWNDHARICKACLAKERFEYVLSRLRQEQGALWAVDEDVARKIAQHQTIAADIERQFEAESTFGQRLADRVAELGGSWPFLLAFFVILALWAVLNSVVLRDAFDPYPYILLNLVLSCLAAVQAPIIMMSQNRLAAHDRLQASHDFRINLKAELEIASLHDKMDHLLHTQWQHMVELQEMQLDLLNELAGSRK